jgi:filamentous hemagglutinin
MSLDSLGSATDPAVLISKLQPGPKGIDGFQVKALFRSEGVSASFVRGRTVDSLARMTNKGNPVVVRISDGNEFSHWVVVDGVTTRGPSATPVVAIRDSAGGKQYFSPVETFKKNFTGEVVVPRPNKR